MATCVYLHLLLTDSPSGYYMENPDAVPALRFRCVMEEWTGERSVASGSQRGIAARALGEFGGRRRARGLRLVARLVFFAPAFDLHVIEDLAQDAAQESLEIRVLEIAQASDGFLLV